MAKNKEVPLGIKIVSILYYIWAALLFVSSILILVGGTVINALNLGIDLAALGATLFIIFLAFAVIAFLIARELWRAKNWARIVAIILSILGFVSAIAATAQGNLQNLVGLVIHGIIAGYLLFNKSVKKAFA